MSEEGIQLLVGKTVVEVDGMWSESESVHFRCNDGECFEMYHMQDCCESVVINSVDGDESLLVGHQVLSATEETNRLWDGDDAPESHTWTIFKIRTTEGTVVVKWLGVSNGYYSESVYFTRAHKRIW